MTDTTQLIDRFVAGGDTLAAALEGVTQQQLDAHPGPGDWSIRELVVHVADSDAIALDRMRRVIAEDRPQLLGADESAYVRTLHCDKQSIDDAVQLVAIGRRQFGRVLRALDRDVFDRVGVHNEAGELTVLDLLRIYADHLEYHVGFLRAKRERMAQA
jgi:uncharacterized damage-inducible protein DinB